MNLHILEDAKNYNTYINTLCIEIYTFMSTFMNTFTEVFIFFTINNVFVLSVIFLIFIHFKTVKVKNESSQTERTFDSELNECIYVNNNPCYQIDIAI